MRRVHRREDHIPKGARAYRDRQSSAVVYSYTNGAGLPALMGFHGRAQKPDFHCYFANDAHREGHANGHFKRWREWEKARAPKTRELAVGDVLKASWGYDQTNIDYYQVTALVGAKSVEIREIKNLATYDGQAMAGHCVPQPGEFTGKPMIKRADGDGVRIASYAWAHKVEPRMVGGVPTYGADRYTAYA